MDFETIITDNLGRHVYVTGDISGRLHTDRDGLCTDNLDITDLIFSFDGKIIYETKDIEKEFPDFITLNNVKEIVQHAIDDYIYNIDQRDYEKNF